MGIVWVDNEIQPNAGAPKGPLKVIQAILEVNKWTTEFWGSFTEINRLRKTTAEKDLNSVFSKWDVETVDKIVGECCERLAKIEFNFRV